jgi:hypothetical protein
MKAVLSSERVNHLDFTGGGVNTIADKDTFVALTMGEGTGIDFVNGIGSD